MSVTVTDAGPFEKLVTFTVAESEIDAAKSQAARRLAKDLKIPGFRPGKAPRPIVEATVGRERLRSEAIDDMLPGKVGDVLEDVDFELAVSPSLESLDEVEDGVRVEVRITTWPTLSDVPEIHDRAVEVGSVEVSDEELEEQVNRIRDQFGTLDDIDRPADDGDFVTIDISATADGMPVEQATAKDLVYEVGSGGFVEGIDDLLVGAVAGDTVTLDGPLPAGFGDDAGREVTFSVVVGKVRHRVRPELTDEWVEEITEFESIDEMRDELREEMRSMKLRSLANRFRERALGELVDQVDVEIPEAILRSEIDDLLHTFGHRLESQEVTFADYLRVTGMTQEAFLADVRAQAERGVRTRLLLDAIADQEGLEVTEDELMAVLEGVTSRDESHRTDPSMLREALRGAPEEKSITGDILRNKALERILSSARPVDEAGNEVDLTIDVPDVVQGEVLPGEAVSDEPFTADVVEGEIVEGEIVMDDAGAGAPTEEE